ncbi:MAG: ABC transporter ATP-binding protein [Haloferacaceae archaeon]
MSAVALDSVSKTYGSVTAVDDLSLSVEEGEVFGFLGPNGAGKSTTINLMLDFASPDSGAISVFGHDAQRESLAIRRRSGLLLEGYGAYPELTGREHVAHAVETKGADDDPDTLLNRVGLDAADRRAGTYSKGMRQRMAIAVALVGAPDLLVLDEPSTGLDPNGARKLREIVREESARGATVFFSSHILEQVEAVADRIGILRDGRLSAVGQVDALRDELGAGTTVEIRVSEVPDDLHSRLESVAGVRDVQADDGTVRVACDGGEAKLRALKVTADAGVYRDFRLRETSLGDVFSAYTEAGTDAGGDGTETATDGGRT